MAEDEELDLLETVRIDFGISSDDLEPEKITRELGINPSRAFKKGEAYLSKALDPETKQIVQVWYEHPWGVWAINSSILEPAAPVEQHAQYLLDILEPRREQWLRYIHDEDLVINLSIWWETNSNAGGYDLKSETLQRLTLLCHRVDFRFIYR